VSASWQDNPFAFEDGFDDGFDQAVADGASPRRVSRRLGDRRVLALALVSVAGAVVAVALGASEAGWLTVAVGGLAYLAAAVSDLRQRSIRQARRVYGRPWSTASLRIVVFLAVVGGAWLAARGLAAP
jgi:hypothetical protein